MNYVHLISSPFYISSESDINLFKNEDERAYFKLIHNSLKKAELTRNQNLDVDDYMFYQNNFSKICNRRILDLGLDFYRIKGLNYIEQNIALNELCSKMVYPLVKKNLKIFAKLFIKNISNSFGSSRQMLLFLGLLCYGLFNFNRSSNNIYKFIIIATLFMFANNTLIALVVHSIKRYIFYFDWVIFATFIILFDEIYKKTVK